MLLLINAIEGRDVATADIAGAFLKAFIKDFVLVRIVGESVDILCRVNPEYNKYVCYEKGNKVLYMRLNKALYGCMQSSLLRYETFTKHLKTLGFTAWYVDDTMILHKDPKVVSWVIKQIENTFGKMTVKRGPQHTFIGMDFELTKDKKVKITMTEYIKECIAAFGEEIKGSAKTPAKQKLFERS